MDLRCARLVALTLVAGALLLGVLPRVAVSQENGREEPATLATEASRRAAKKALQWLVEHQEDNGAWRCNVGFKLNNDYKIEHANQPHVGITALAGTAFLASGSVPGRGPYADNVERALRFVMSCQQKNGYISANGTRMYEHAFATLFLAEAYGMTHDESVKTALQKAVEFTYKAQNSQGGWRYVPNAEDSDMSIVVCQVMALRAAKNKGITVPKESIDKAVDYVLSSAITGTGSMWSGYDFEKGTFLYQYDVNNMQASVQSRTSFALTSAGLTTLYGAGIYTNRDINDFIRQRGIAKFRPGGDPPPRFEDMIRYVREHYSEVASMPTHYFFFYGNYYAAQAMFITGGEDCESYYTRLRDDLVHLQRPDGSVSSLVGDAFSTAVTALLLEIPNNYLPIFQR
jgi:pectate lyase-like protein/prenyltransferase/squalene oxidase-like repeat protein